MTRKKCNIKNRMDSITKYIPRKIKRFCRNKENISPSRTKKYKPNQGSRPFRSRQRRSTDEPHHIEKTPVEQMTPEPLAVTAQSAAGVVVPHINNSMIGGSIYTTVNFHGNSSKNESEVQTEHPGRRPPDFPAQHQKSSSEEDIKLQDTKQRNKSSLKKKNESIFEGIARPGKSVFLNHVYTKLCITEGDCRGVNDEHEVWHQQETSRWEISQEKRIHINDIFKPLPGQEKPIRTVLMKGIAGIGKTVSVQKFILNWLEGQANQDVFFIFQFAFHELNAMTHNDLSLKKLLYMFYPETENIAVENYNVLFVFDGLDEYQYPLTFFTNRCGSITETAPLSVLLSNLIEGNLLPSALIWITSRPAAASQIPPRFIQQVMEIRGFNDHQKEEYFRKKFPDNNQADKVIALIKSSRSLHIMCHIPIFCWNSAAVIEQMLTKDDQEIPSILTQMYSRFLLIQINVMNKKPHGYIQGNLTKLQQRDKKIIMKLAEFAFKQLEKGSVWFSKEDLKACGIGNVKGPSAYSALCTEILKEDIALVEEKFSCFIHLTIQEYLAALHVFNLFATEKMSLLKAFFKTKPRTLHHLHKAAVNKVLEHKNGQFDLFLRFLLGMSHDVNLRLLEDLLPSITSSSKSMKNITEYIKNVLKKKNVSPERCINLVYCLTELNVLDDFDHKKCKMSEEDHKRLEPVIKHSRSPQCCETVALHSHLTQLCLSHKNLGDLGLEKLCPGLKSPNCKLESLDLSFNKLTTLGMKLLSDVLEGPHCKLKILDLSNNELGDSGVNVLCKALCRHHCRLKTLRLSNCGVTEGGCASLASALHSNPSHLTELVLLNNYPGDSGVREILEILEDSSLESLSIGDVGNLKKELKKYARKFTLEVKTVNKNLYIKLNRRKRKRDSSAECIKSFCYSNKMMCKEGPTG